MSLEFSEKWHSVGENAGYSYSSLHCLDLSSDGRWLAVGGGSRLFIVDADSGALKVTLTQNCQIADVRWLRSESAVLVCAFEDGMICNVSLTETRKGIIGLKYLWQPGHQISCISVDAAGKLLATGSSDIRIWTMSTCSMFQNWTKHRRLEKHDHDWNNRGLPVIITGMHWKDSSSLVVSYRHHGIQVWDIPAASVISNVVSTMATEIGPSSLSIAHGQVAFATQETYEVHDVVTRKFVATFRNSASQESAHRVSVNCSTGPVAFCLREQAVIGRYNGTSARVWGVRDHIKIQTFTTADHGMVQAIAVKDWPVGDHSFAIAVASASSITLWVTRDTDKAIFIRRLRSVLRAIMISSKTIVVTACIAFLALVIQQCVCADDGFTLKRILSFVLDTAPQPAHEE